MSQYNPYTVGAPRTKEFDLEEIEKLASIGCTYKEIARLSAEMSEQNFLRYRQQRPEIQEALDRGRANMKKSLRHAQYKAGVDDGNVPMLIHLGKHYLDQKEKMDINQSFSGDIEVVTKFGRVKAKEDSEDSSA